MNNSTGLAKAKPSVLVSGLVALDVIRSTSGTWLRAGGTAGNVAAILSFLGWRSAVLGQIGDDDAGPIVERDLQAAGVDTSLLRLSPEAGTPIVVHEIHETGHRYRFGCVRCGRRYRPHRPAHPQTVTQYLVQDSLADVFFFDRATNASLSVAKAHRDAGRLVLYEPGSAGRLELHKRALALAHIVKFSDERRPLFEGALGDPPESQLWIESRGADGVQVRSAQEVWERIPAFEVARVDAGGAGDWLTAGMLSRLDLSSWPREASGRMDALRYGVALAGLACLLPGARTLSELVAVDELERLTHALMEGRSPSLPTWPPVAAATSRQCPACRLPLVS